MAPLDFFRLGLQLRLALLIEDFLLAESPVFVVIIFLQFALQFILIEVEHEGVKVAGIEHVFRV